MIRCSCECAVDAIAVRIKLPDLGSWFRTLALSSIGYPASEQYRGHAAPIQLTKPHNKQCAHAHAPRMGLGRRPALYHWQTQQKRIHSMMALS
jgi:hypothetical protein